MKPSQGLSVHRKATSLFVVIIGLTGVLGPRPCAAQLLSQYLPASVPGYAADPVMAVIAAGGPDYNSSGVRLGNYVIRPTIDETIGFDENPLGLSEERSSATVESSASVSANSDWERNALGASLSIDDHHYLEEPIANTTTANAYAGGSLDLFQNDQLNVSGGYTSSALSPTSVLTQGLTAPVPYTTSDIRAGYVWRFNRLTVTPSVDYAQYRFGTAYGSGIVQSYSGLDKNQIDGGATATYRLLPALNAVLSWQELSASFLHNDGGTQNPNYLDTLVLGGVRDEEDALFHWAVLVGFDDRSFSGGSQHAIVQPAVEAALTYYPTQLTTATASVTRRLSDASYNIAENLTYTEGTLEVDHAYRRNIILLGKLDVAYTDANATSAAHTQLSATAGATWLLSRNVHLSARYIFSYGSYDGSLAAQLGVPAADLAGTGNTSYTSNAVTMTIHLQL